MPRAAATHCSLPTASHVPTRPRLAADCQSQRLGKLDRPRRHGTHGPVLHSRTCPSLLPTTSVLATSIGWFPSFYITSHLGVQMKTVATAAAVALLVALASSPTDAQRLPGESLPRSYKVTFAPNLNEGEQPFRFYGSTFIEVEVVRDTPTLTMHADVDIVTVSVMLTNGTLIGASHEPLQDGSNFLVITLQEQVFAGDRLTVVLEFVGDVRERYNGFYRSSYEQDGETRWLGVTQFERRGARKAMPCYDEPAIKATWEFTFRPQQGYNVLFNTPLISATDDEDGRRTLTFEQTPVMSAFLLAWVVSDFVGVQSPLESNTTVWTSRDTAAQAEYASVIGPRTVRSMEQLVRVPYNHGNLTKMDHVAVPDTFVAAMENWGLITYNQQFLLALDNYTSEATKERVLTSIQHEVAHQWFGDLVSPNWWSVLWLSEGLATFFESFASALLEPTWRIDEAFVVSTLLRQAIAYDEDPSAAPITSEDAGINIYYKGGSIVRMMQHFIGTDAFYDGLHNYLLQNQFSNATDDILFAAMDAVASSSDLPSDATVSSVMLPWARQAGFPLITVTRNYSDGSAVVTQNRWLVPADPSDETTWTVPVTYTSKSEAAFSTSTRLWLTDTTSRLDNVADAAADDWVIFNLNVVGFYRVQYDTDNWALLVQQLLSDHEVIPPVNRALLLDDARALVEADLLPLDTLLNLTSYLAQEMDYIPWLEAETVLSELSSIIDSGEFDTLVQEVVASVTSTLGYVAQPGDSHVTRVLRGIVSSLACSANQPACTEAAYSHFQRYMANPDDPANWVDPDMKSVVYCEGVRQGGDEAYNFLQEQYQNTNVISEMNEISSAFSCQSNSTSIRHLLQMTAAGTQDGIHQKHLPILLEAALRRHRGESVAAAIEFLFDNPKVLLSRYIDKKTIRKLLTDIISTTCDQHLLDKASLLATSMGNQRLASATSSRHTTLAHCHTLRHAASRWLRHWIQQRQHNSI
ncbi:aminopeptidase N-like [Schistocerca serialis cubense]|uniref:aminopeptidase N-like n=1 Tax=Schistocerca serialis cubense TaxID=2023355 RepID=UPI00214ECB28|nr:aminopeptidase N-like [Schistocerca serialis cubense]